MAEKKHFHVGIEGANNGFDRFVKAWHQAQAGKANNAEVRVNFAELAMLLPLLTPERFELLKTLRQQGPLSMQALAKNLNRELNKVAADIDALQEIDLIQADDNNNLMVPWDVIDVHLDLLV